MSPRTDSRQESKTEYSRCSNFAEFAKEANRHSCGGRNPVSSKIPRSSACAAMTSLTWDYWWAFLTAHMAVNRTLFLAWVSRARNRGTAEKRLAISSSDIFKCGSRSFSCPATDCGQFR